MSSLAVILAALILLPLASASAKKLDQPEVDAAVQVTSDPGVARGHAVPTLAIHPDDAQTIVIADSDAWISRCQVNVSRNGGLTWARASQPTTPPDWQGCGFAVTGPMADLAFAPDGTLYYTWSAVQANTYQQRIYVARSSDLGLTWNVTAAPRIGPDPAQRLFGADTMPSLVVDRDQPSRVYVSWWSGNGVWNMPEAITGASSSVWCRLVDNKILARPWVAASTDGGRTFGAPVDAAPGIGHCTTEPYMSQAKDGSLLVYYGEATRTLEAGKAPPAHLLVSRSTDGGKSFTVTNIHEQDGVADTRAATSTSDWLGAPSPGVNLDTGELYVTWEEMGQDVPKIFFSRSSDTGRTWSAPVKVNDGDPKRDWDFPEQFPTMGVAPNGRIDVAWYDWRSDATFKAGDTRNGFQDVYYASSTDGGRTWSKNVALNDRAIDRRFGTNRQGDIRGPLGVASTDEAVYVAWDDTRNGNETTVSQDIYFTRVRYTTAAEAFGGESGGGGTSPVTAAFLGAAIAVAAVGLILILGTQAARRREGPSERAPSATPSTPTKEPTAT